MKTNLHIISLPNRIDYFNQLYSDLTNEKVDISLIPGSIGSIVEKNKNRKLGYLNSYKSESKYIGYIDDDDRVIKGTIAKLESYLDENPDIDVVCCYEDQIDSNNNIIRRAIFNNFDSLNLLNTALEFHHLWIARKQCVIDVISRLPIDLNDFDWITVIMLSLKYNLAKLDFVGYQWRRYKSQHSSSIVKRDIKIASRLNSDVIKILRG